MKISLYTPVDLPMFAAGPRDGMVDIEDLKSSGLTAVPVRVRPRVPSYNLITFSKKIANNFKL